MRSIVEEQTVRLPADGAKIEGNLSIPPAPRGLVIFAHGSGSSRHSPRNRFVAERLREGGMGTLLIDLLTEDEEQIDAVAANFRFDIDLLARRLADAARWAADHDETRALPAGYFGASTGAAAALVAAARAPEQIGAVVSRGGRPDLAGGLLGQVRAPTLLIVGGRDTVVIGMNEAARRRLRCKKDLQIVPGATHLFEEPGALEQVAELASGWFAEWLRRPAGGPR